MSDGSLGDHLATLHRAVEATEERFSRGELAIDSVEETKRSLDDIRLRLWGLLKSAGDDDPQAFQERFRIRRAAELCDRLAADLRLGTMSPLHAEWSDLWIAAIELTRTIEGFRGPTPP